MEPTRSPHRPIKSGARATRIAAVLTPLFIVGTIISYCVRFGMRFGMRFEDFLSKWLSNSLKWLWNSLERQLGTTVSLVAIVVILVLAIALMQIYHFLDHRRRQLVAPDAVEALSTDPRPPVLYLRSFEADRSTFAETWEAHLEIIFSRLGPMVAVGEPGERYQMLGVPRMYVGDDWESEVTRLAAGARLLIFRIGRTEGFWWEVSEIATRADPRHVLFFLPRKGFPWTRRALYRAFRARAGPILGSKLPDTLGGAEFLWFGANREPILLHPGEPRWRLDWKYQRRFSRRLNLPN
jgi:hypothetical protein